MGTKKIIKKPEKIIKKLECGVCKGDGQVYGAELVHQYDLTLERQRVPIGCKYCKGTGFIEYEYHGDVG